MTSQRCLYCDQLPNIEFIHRWMNAENPMLGGLSPMGMLKAGKGNRLAQFIESAREAEGIQIECGECLEKSRLLGMGGERELKLIAELSEARQLLGVYREQRDCAERKVTHLEKTCEKFGVVPARMEE